MKTLLFAAPAFLSLFILILPGRMRFLCLVMVSVTAALFSSWIAVTLLSSLSVNGRQALLEVIPGGMTLTIDPLSALFILVTNLVVLAGLLYSHGYLAPYRMKKPPALMALHYFAFAWLHLSMLMVLMLRDGLGFLISWELMALSSFLLILFEAEIRTTLKTAVNYLLQMHIGLVLLIVAFLIAERASGIFGFGGIHMMASGSESILAMSLFLAGFAIKAGFLPFHTWLPEAHPAAPSHVSGVMSGVMIKMGIYGILRIISELPFHQSLAGILLLAFGAATALYGIMQAAVQTDLKKILAFSSMENIGIIGIGIGLGALGLGQGNIVLAMLGFTGALLHVLNHSLFKPLLFFAAGSVYKATHTRHIDHLGGLVHGMPSTSILFLTGSAAICALPPLNGFVSEILIYYGLFTALPSEHVFQSIGIMLVLIALALTGGLAVFTFTRAYGMTFSGVPRKGIAPDEKTISPAMFLPQFLFMALILAIGLFPLIFVKPLMVVADHTFGNGAGVDLHPLMNALAKIGQVGMILGIIVLSILLIRRYLRVEQRTTFGPTWGCGYTAGTPVQQYTASSYAANFTELANPLLRTRDDASKFAPEALFPGNGWFRRRTGDVFHRLAGKATDYTLGAMKRIARLQTGNIRHYILYAFIFMLVIFALLYLNLI